MWLGGQLKTYKHNEGVNPNFILDGASGNDDITEYSISQIPRL
jgi:penicillin amidase